MDGPYRETGEQDGSEKGRLCCPRHARLEGKSSVGRAAVMVAGSGGGRHPPPAGRAPDDVRVVYVC